MIIIDQKKLHHVILRKALGERSLFFEVLTALLRANREHLGMGLGIQTCSAKSLNEGKRLRLKHVLRKSWAKFGSVKTLRPLK